eukprot:3941517-Rhodomonas_salina.5
MCGADIGYAATRSGGARVPLEAMMLSYEMRRYSAATPCDARYGHRPCCHPLRCYAATLLLYAVCGTDPGYAATLCGAMLLPYEAMLLRYAVRGTDIGYAATLCGV